MMLLKIALHLLYRSLSVLPFSQPHMLETGQVENLKY